MRLEELSNAVSGVLSSDGNRLDLEMREARRNLYGPEWARTEQSKAA